jgi:hypothetical protein
LASFAIVVEKSVVDVWLTHTCRGCPQLDRLTRYSHTGSLERPELCGVCDEKVLVVQEVRLTLSPTGVPSRHESAPSALVDVRSGPYRLWNFASDVGRCLFVKVHAWRPRTFIGKTKGPRGV